MKVTHVGTVDSQRKVTQRASKASGSSTSKQKQLQHSALPVDPGHHVQRPPSQKPRKPLQHQHSLSDVHNIGADGAAARLATALRQSHIPKPTDSPASPYRRRRPNPLLRGSPHAPSSLRSPLAPRGASTFLSTLAGDYISCSASEASPPVRRLQGASGLRNETRFNAYVGQTKVNKPCRPGTPRPVTSALDDEPASAYAPPREDTLIQDDASTADSTEDSRPASPLSTRSEQAAKEQQGDDDDDYNGGDGYAYEQQLPASRQPYRLRPAEAFEKLLQGQLDFRQIEDCVDAMMRGHVRESAHAVLSLYSKSFLDLPEDDDTDEASATIARTWLRAYDQFLLKRKLSPTDAVVSTLSANRVLDLYTEAVRYGMEWLRETDAYGSRLQVQQVIAYLMHLYALLWQAEDVLDDKEKIAQDKVDKQYDIYFANIAEFIQKCPTAGPDYRGSRRPPKPKDLWPGHAIDDSQPVASFKRAPLCPSNRTGRGTGNASLRRSRVTDSGADDESLDADDESSDADDAVKGGEAKLVAKEKLKNGQTMVKPKVAGPELITLKVLCPSEGTRKIAEWSNERSAIVRGATLEQALAKVEEQRGYQKLRTVTCSITPGPIKAVQDIILQQGEEAFGLFEGYTAKNRQQPFKITHKEAPSRTFEKQYKTIIEKLPINRNKWSRTEVLNKQLDITKARVNKFVADCRRLKQHKKLCATRLSWAKVSLAPEGQAYVIAVLPLLKEMFKEERIVATQKHMCWIIEVSGNTTLTSKRENSMKSDRKLRKKKKKEEEGERTGDEQEYDDPAFDAGFDPNDSDAPTLENRRKWEAEEAEPAPGLEMPESVHGILHIFDEPFDDFGGDMHV